MDMGWPMIFGVDDDFKWANDKDRRHNCIIHTMHVPVKFKSLASDGGDVPVDTTSSAACGEVPPIPTIALLFSNLYCIYGLYILKYKDD